MTAIDNIHDHKEENDQFIKKAEADADIYEDHLGDYLVQLSGRELSDDDSMNVTKTLHSIGNFERISDHARNLAESAEELSGKGLELSDHALAELDKLENAVKEILEITVEAYETNNADLAKKVEPLEEVIDVFTETIKVRHIGRLRKGECTIENGFVLSDMLNNYERISDHCSNIAMAVLEMQLGGRAEPHEYLGKVRTMQDADYKAAYEEYETKYAI